MYNILCKKCSFYFRQCFLEDTPVHALIEKDCGENWIMEDVVLCEKNLKPFEGCLMQFPLFFEISLSNWSLYSSWGIHSHFVSTAIRSLPLPLSMVVIKWLTQVSNKLRLMHNQINSICKIRVTTQLQNNYNIDYESFYNEGNKDRPVTLIVRIQASCSFMSPPMINGCATLLLMWGARVTSSFLPWSVNQTDFKLSFLHVCPTYYDSSVNEERYQNINRRGWRRCGPTLPLHSSFT